MRNRESLFPPLWVLTLVVACLALWLLFELRDILVLFVVGYSIAYVINPWLDQLERHKISRPAGVLVIILLLSLVLLLLALSAMPTVLREAERLADKLPSYLALVEQRLTPYLNRAEQLFPSMQHLPAQESWAESVGSYLPDFLRKAATTAGAALLGGYSMTMAIANLLLLPFIVFYLAVDFKRLHQGALMLVPTLKRAKVQALFLEMDSYVSAFVRGQLLVCMLLFCLYALGLGLVGIELWFLMAVIAGFGNIVPFLGFALGITLSTVMSLVTFGDWHHLFLVWVVFAVVQTLEGTVITPRILGQKVGLSPLAVILALFAGSTLFGLLGLFLAVPGAAVLKVLFRHFSTWMLQR